ncbi:MAG TPA: methionine adenosyltransferase, partial [Gammaproteobacteria bacterium]|nr:methionine adenosyltransferase [Gammaproteobacteria bacterium]
SIRIETFGTSQLTNSQLDQLVRAHFDLRPRAISTMLDLNRAIYRPTAAYGHFGRNDLDLTWERTDRAQALAEAAAKL